MTDLKSTLAQFQIDVSTLQVMYEAGAETLYMLTCPGTAAIALWQRLHTLVDATGYWPVVMGEQSDLEMHFHFIRDEPAHNPKLTSREIITNGLKLDPQSWLQNIRDGDDDEEFYAEVLYARDEQLEEEEDDYDEGSSLPLPRYTIPFDLNGKPFPLVYIGLMPTRFSWEVPAYLRYGNWNACPTPAEHVCLLKYWHDLYGAEVVGISHDVIEMLVARPPQDPESVWKLAEEQYRYCEDIVTQGVGTVQELARELKNSPTWYFWWD